MHHSTVIIWIKLPFQKKSHLIYSLSLSLKLCKPSTPLKTNKQKNNNTLDVM